jgi:hypothetical protein
MVGILTSAGKVASEKLSIVTLAWREGCRTAAPGPVWWAALAFFSLGRGVGAGTVRPDRLTSALSPSPAAGAPAEVDAPLGGTRGTLDQSR